MMFRIEMVREVVGRGGIRIGFVKRKFSALRERPVGER